MKVFLFIPMTGQYPAACSGMGGMSESDYLHASHNVSNLVYHFVSTVGKHSNEDIIAEYVRKQGKPEDEEYMQLSIFD